MEDDPAAVFPRTAALGSNPKVFDPEMTDQENSNVDAPTMKSDAAAVDEAIKPEESPKDTGEQREHPTNPTGHKEREGAWVGHRVEYRDTSNGQILFSSASRTAEEISNTSTTNQPIFEHVTTYKANASSFRWAFKPTAVESKGKETLPRVRGAASSYSILIYSTAIINALQSVVTYYPSQSLSGDVLKIDKPYCVLAHYYDELVEFRNQIMSKKLGNLCVREKDAPEHLQLLLEFLDDAVMGEVRAEIERNQRGYWTYEYSWYAYKPGCVAVERPKENTRSDWDSFVVHEVSGGPFGDNPRPWTVKGWKLTFDGTYLDRTTYALCIDESTGELRTSTRFIYDKKDLDDDKAREKIAHGRKYWDLVKKQCQYYKGRSYEFPYNEVDGLVMTDMKAYYTRFFDNKPTFLETSDLRKRTSDCTCSVCKQGNMTPRHTRNDWSTFISCTIEQEPILSDYDYLLCPHEIPAFVFRTRTWETLHVKDFQIPQFGESMIDYLVTKDEHRISTLKALAKAFARENAEGVEIKKDPWSADFVKGKGNGLIFLLHGKPGVGKTYTAECIAEYTKRPLMVLTSSDIGTDPSRVERILTVHFKTATSWGAVLLIDEADVFMERRGTADLARNSLVAGFLRALEFYEGILFLTTNRVGAFDDAFISRVHIKLYYPDFSDTERQKVWETFVKKLTKERGDYMRVTIGAQEYIREAKQLKGLSWNGREIRNAFQTAVSLAEYENKQDGEGKIVLTEDHLKSVVELSKDFKSYLDTLHLADESKRALARKERLDSFDK